MQKEVHIPSRNVYLDILLTWNKLRARVERPCGGRIPVTVRYNAFGLMPRSIYSANLYPMVNWNTLLCTFASPMLTPKPSQSDLALSNTFVTPKL